MLTEAERRQLADIESAIRETDPGFAEQLARGWTRQRQREAVARVGTVVALVLAATGIALAHLDLVVLSVASIAVALVAVGLALFLDR